MEQKKERGAIFMKFIKRKLPAVLLAAAMLVVWSVPVFAAESSLAAEESLLDIVRPYVHNVDEAVSRGAFSHMLVKAANLPHKDTEKSKTLPPDLGDAWYKDSVLILWEKDIMKGAPDGKVYPDNPVTVREAKALVARTLGVPDQVIFEAEGTAGSGLDRELYSFVRQYFEDDDKSRISVKKAAEILSDIFGVDEEAEEIILKNQEATGSAKSFRASGAIEAELVYHQEVEGVPASMSYDFFMELSADSKLKQEISMVMPGVSAPLEMTQYMDKDYIYSMIPNQEGTPQWTKMKNISSFAFDDAYIESMKNQTLNFNTELPYKLLGKGTIDGTECWKLAFYATIYDKEELLKTFDSMPGMDGTVKGQLEQSLDIIKSLKFKGIMYIGQEDNMMYGAQIDYDVLLNAEAQAESPVKIESINFIMDIRYSDFGEDIRIEIPQEAIDAEEISLF